jgi:ornithine cyclodeaminase/alanine dehydrogenase-like protein (mu-crystallin family)
MPLFIREEEVLRLLPMADALACVEEAFRLHGSGKAINNPRTRVRTEGATLHSMAAALPSLKALGYKTYTTARGRAQFHFHLYDCETGELLAVAQANHLGQIRTGAASGVSTKHMARQDAKVLGVIGTGFQAVTQVEAVCAVRPIERVVVFGRQAERRRAFCEEMTRRLGGLPVHPAERPEEAVAAADVVVTITSSREPVFDGAHLKAGTHVNAAGSNSLLRREVDEETVRRSGVIAVDDREQAKTECGDLFGPVQRGALSWEGVRELGEIVAGRSPGRRDASEITLFASQGLALEDVAVGLHVYRLAKAQGAGAEIAL